MLKKFCFLFLLSFILNENIYASNDNIQLQNASQCIHQIAQSIDDSDVTTFEKLIDIDAILQEALKLFLAEAQKPENSSQLPPILALVVNQAVAQDSAGETVRTLILRESKAFVLNGVSSGSFAGKKAVNNNQQQGMLAPFFLDASTGKKEFRNISDAIKNGNDYIVSFNIFDHGNGETYPVIGKINQVNSIMRLVQIVNLQELFDRVRKEALGLTE